MHLKAKTLFASVLCTIMLLVSHPGARAQGNPPGVDPTHYWTYRLLQPFPYPQPIAVRDQFFPAYVPNQTDTLQRLLNWVIKTDLATGFNSVPTDTFLHYTWWNLKDKLPVNEFVTVTNQFGSYPVQVHQLDFLLAPAWKNYNSPVPPHGSHYLCYRADGFPPPTRAFAFHDEWRFDQLPIGPLEFLCVPCWKQHQGQVFEPLDTLTHLAVYRIPPISDTFYPLLSDQFFNGPHLVRQTPPEYLFVPSTKKLIVTDTKKSSWGRLKTLYR